MGQGVWNGCDWLGRDGMGKRGGGMKTQVAKQADSKIAERITQTSATTQIVTDRQTGSE